MSILIRRKNFYIRVMVLAEVALEESRKRGRCKVVIEAKVEYAGERG